MLTIAIAALTAGAIPTARVDDFTLDPTFWPAAATAATTISNGTDLEIAVAWSDGNALHVLHVPARSTGDIRTAPGEVGLTVSARGRPAVRVSIRPVGSAGGVLRVSPDGSAAFSTDPAS